MKEFNWCVVEQPHFVNEGKKTFANNNLHFFYDVETCTEAYTINTALFASSLQYIENPYLLLKDIFLKNIDYIIIDRMPFLKTGMDRITIQKVSKKIYDASYPCWILNETKFVSYLSEHYDMIYDFESPDRMNLRNAALKGFFFIKRTKTKQSL